MKRKKRPVTILVNLLFIAAIAAVGWKIYDYVRDTNQTTELSEELWQQVAITAAPAAADVYPAGTPSAAENARPDGTIPEAGDIRSAGNPEIPSQPGNIPAAAQNARSEEKPIPTLLPPGMTAEPAAGEKQTEVHIAGENNTPSAPASNREITDREAAGREGGGAMIRDVLSETATPIPSPRFTDDPEIPVGIDFDTLMRKNWHTAAWIYHPAMELNYPVVHTTDNEFYLSHGFGGNESNSGTLFIDYRNKRDFSDRNTIIYGHARRALNMFGKLKYYKEADYCAENPFFYLYVPGHRYRLEIVAVGSTTDASRYYDLPAGNYWLSLLEKLKARCPYDFGIPVSPDDHYVTLSTCAYDFMNERWLVVARIDDPEGTLTPLNQ